MLQRHIPAATLILFGKPLHLIRHSAPKVEQHPLWLWQSGSRLPRVSDLISIVNVHAPKAHPCSEGLEFDVFQLGLGLFHFFEVGFG